MKLLLTGVSGLLGANIAWRLRDQCDILGIYGRHTFKPKWLRTVQVDLTDEQACARTVESFEPDLCIHCAAWTDVDGCEAGVELAEAINVGITRHIARRMALGNRKLVLISTDAVYGDGPNAFTEHDMPRPINVYARTKLQAEHEALVCAKALVLRTSFVGWGIAGGNRGLVGWLVDELSNGKEVLGFADVYTSSVYAGFLSGVIYDAVLKGVSGIYNCGSWDSRSKLEIAMDVARRLGVSGDLVRSISVDEYRFRARRPKSLRIDSRKLEQILGTPFPSVTQGLDAMFSDRDNIAAARGSM